MNEKKHWIRLVIAVMISAVSGCGAQYRAAAEDQIRDLEREVARLSSERANMDARAAALDDKVILLETRLKKCSTADVTHSLEVVKLSPSTADDAAEEELTGTDEQIVDESEDEAPRTKQGKKRPVLVLNEGGGPRNVSPMRRPVGGDLAVPSNFHSLGADNLGVTSADGNSGPGGGGMSTFNEAYRAYSNRRLEAALSGFAEFLKSEPNHAFADDAVYWRGECYLAQGKFLHAIGEFERLVRRYPNSEKVSSGLYRIGFAYDKLRDFSKAYEYYFEVVEKYPGTDAARRAGSRVAEIKNTLPMGETLLPTSAAR